MSRLIVAGERPATTREKEPFTNRAGKHFRSLLAAARINPDTVGYGYPQSVTDLDVFIDERRAEYVIVCGNHVLQLLHPELRTGQCHGRIMAYDGHDQHTPLVMPIFHHEAFVRAPKQMGPVLEQELARFRFVAQHRDDWLQYVADTCVKCRGPLHVMTPQRVAYCRTHWRRPT